MSIGREAYTVVGILLAVGGLSAWHGGYVAAAWFGVGVLTVFALAVWLEHRS